MLLVPIGIHDSLVEHLHRNQGRVGLLLICIHGSMRWCPSSPSLLATSCGFKENDSDLEQH